MATAGAPAAAGAGAAAAAGAAEPASTFGRCTFNLAKVIIGAGMMAIPRAFFTVGSLAGMLMLGGVGLLTYFTLSVLVAGSAATGARTYSALSQQLCGPGTTKVLQLAVLAFCFGFGVVYLVIIRDILLGSPPDCNGLICELTGAGMSGPFADPRLVITAVALLVFAPLLLLRSMDRLAPLNLIGVAAIALLAAVSAGLGVQGLLQGSAHAIPLLPQWPLLGPTPRQQLQSLASVCPVLIACFVAHQSLHPLMPLLVPYSDGRMRGVIAAALGISFSVFATLAVGSAVTFGPHLEVNVLTNFSVAGLEPLVGPLLARCLSWALRIGYGVALVASLLLYMHPLRSCLAEMLWQHRTEAPGAALPDEAHQHPVELPSPAAAAAAAAAAGKRTWPQGSSNGASAVAPPRDANIIDDSRVLLAWDSLDNPKFGSFIGGLKARLNQPRLSGLALARLAAATGAAASGGSSMAAANGRAAAGAAAGSAWPNDGDAEWGAGGRVAAAAAAAAAAAGAGVSPQWRKMEQQHYYKLTYGLLVAMVLTAIAVPNIWTALSVIGDLASTIQAFIVPGLVAVVLAVQQPGGKRHPPPPPGQPDADGDSERAGLLAAGAAGGEETSRSTRLVEQQAEAAVGDNSQPRRLLSGVTGAFVMLLGVGLFANGVFTRL